MNETYNDMLLVCKECGRKFLFTAAEQEYYDGKGFKAPPKRCKDCRRAKRSHRQLYTAVCAACGREAKLPFKPRGDRMVYCGDCFAQMKAEK